MSLSETACTEKYTVVGVVGHIDHGKTTLVATLTGVDTDTHPEEKRRGITIDLGFASFAHEGHQFALIDAPGHQKYIGNLLAGVSRIDIGLLVVACDQGIQAQTLEHASILQSLGVERLIVAISRTDLTDRETFDGLRDELELFLDEFGFTDFPIVSVSSKTGDGIDELKSHLRSAADGCDQSASGSWFRMPVDRVFMMPGRGCVIAGTVWSGAVRPGESLYLTGAGKNVRIREIESHGHTVEQSLIGHRTAINVTGVSVDEVQRGDELLFPDVFPVVQRLLVEIRLFRDAPELKCPATVQLHIAAASVSARIVGAKKLGPSLSAVVVAETDQPVVATFGQRCLLRLPYPVGTIGAGKVVAALPVDRRRSRHLVEFGESLVMASKSERLVLWADWQGEFEPTAELCELQLGIAETDFESTIKSVLDSGRVLRLPDSDRVVSTRLAERIQQHVCEFLRTRAEESNDAWCVEDAVVESATGFGSRELIRWAIAVLTETRQIVRVGRVLAIASEQNVLSKKQKSRMEQIVALFEGNRSPPSVKEITQQLQLSEEVVTSLSRFAVQTGLLTDMGQGLLISTEVFQSLCVELHQLFTEQSERSVAEIRDCWQVTRKHAIPFLEFCDRRKITVRNENNRMAGPELECRLR